MQWGKNLKEEDFNPKTFEHSKIVSTVSSAENYAEAKRQCEYVFSQQKYLPGTSVRFPIVLRPDDYTKRLIFHMERIQNQQPIFFPDIKAHISFVHSTDAALALKFLVENKLEGSFNVAASDPIQLTSLIRLIESKFGKKIVLSSKPEDGSPFGITEDWYMCSEKINEMGFTAKPILEWLPQLFV